MNKSKKTQTIVASIAMVAFTAASLGTATYAWFTRGTEATANGFDFTASAASGIQISTDAANWKSSIVESDFDLTETGAQYGNRLNVASMEPVSTIDTVTAGDYTFWRGTYVDGSYTIATDSANYLVFDLYFLNEGANDLTLQLAGSSSALDGAFDKDTALATRVGFVVEGNSNVPATALGLAGATGASAYLWEPNSTERSDSAISRGAVNSAKYQYNGLKADNGLAEIGTAGIDSLGSLKSNAAYTGLVGSTKDLAIGDSDLITVLPAAGQITKIKVFVWIEGQDIDCNNSAASGDVVISLNFDSGEPLTVLEAKTASAVSGTSVTVGGVDELGVRYSAYVIQNLNHGAVSLDYKLFVGTGYVTYEGTAITAIVIDNAVTALVSYDVVVCAKETGSISTRTVAPITAA